jgi:hypothetical protein
MNMIGWAARKLCMHMFDMVESPIIRALCIYAGSLVQNSGALLSRKNIYQCIQRPIMK